MNQLDHLAIIMDGHRRWAKKSNISRYEGHVAGAYKLIEMCDWAIKHNIRWVTAYVFSSYNWKRSEQEISDVFKIVKHIFVHEADKCIKKNIKILVIGDFSKMTQEIRDIISDIQERTSHCSGLNLVVAIGYGGREEIIYAAKKMFKDMIEQDKDVEDIDIQFFSKYMYNKNIPNVDLVIRTGGAERLSNFYLWQIADSEIYFIHEKTWPEINEKDFNAIIDKFSESNIRRGV